MSKLGDFHHSLLQHKPDVAIITETKLTEEKATDCQLDIPGYGPPVRRDRTAHGGGVAIWVRSGIPHQELNIDNSSQELIWVSVTTSSGNRLGLCGAYRPGTSADTDIDLFTAMEAGIDRVRQTCSHVILAGDFNVHNTPWLGSSRTTLAGETAEDMCYLHNLQQHVSEPTRGNNILDLVMSDIPGAVTTTTQAPLGRSDHCVILCDFALTPPREPPTSRTVWRYQQADWNRLRAFFRSTDWENVLMDDVNRSCANLTGKILEGMHTFIPSKTLLTQIGDPTWWTPECSAAIKAKERAWRAHRRSPGSDALKDRYHIATSNCSNRIDNAYQSHVSGIRRKIAEGSLSSRQWWSTIKKSGGLGRTQSIPILKDGDDSDLTTSQDKAEHLAKYFSSKCTLTPDLSPNNLPRVRSRSTATLQTVRFRPSTVRRQLKQLNPWKATGSDGIPARVLKMCCDELSKPVSLLFSRSFTSGTQPTLWKLANVVPVHKKKSKSDVRNYRPISLLPILSKVMESIVNRSLMNFLEAHNVLSSNQFGFRRGIGTQDVLTLLHHQWSRVAARGGAVRVIAVDIAGAFDKVSHVGVLHKAEEYGIRGTLLQWLRDYLSERKLKVVLDGHSSRPYDIKAGVPQGSILGPTLFLLYVNDAEDHLPNGVRLAVYADDTTLFQLVHTKPAIPMATATLQSGINALSRWGSDWRITFEPSKSQGMTISHHRSPWEFQTVSFNGTDICPSSSVRLLGVDFDTTLEYRQHLRRVCTKANQRLGLLRRASSILEPADREKAYKGFVRPVLEYAPLAWMGAARCHLERLNKVQRKALEIIGGHAWLPSLALRRMVSALCYIYKLHTMGEQNPLRTMLPRPPTPRPPGVQPTRAHVAEQRRHAYQLSVLPTPRTRNSVLRSFPEIAVPTWNMLPDGILGQPPSAKRMQRFKETAYKHLLRHDWMWATDSL